MQPPEVALQHAAARKALAARVGAYAEALWSAVDPAAIVASWSAKIPNLLAILVGAQLQAASTADAYVEEAAGALGQSAAADFAVAGPAFAGLAADGRDLASLLYEPAISALSSIKAGRSVAEGMAAGRANLSMIARTEVADAGRNADQVAMTSHRSVPGYVRVVVGKTCSRCVVLAGRWHPVNAGFDRHPQCDCIGLPAGQAHAARIIQDPARVYATMTPAERSAAGWSKADQAAIAEGADISQVTNIHRKGSLYVVGGKQATREGATRRGLYGGYELDPATGVLRKRAAAARPRLTPNQIFADAKGDRDEAIRLLQENGYLLKATGRTAPVKAGVPKAAKPYHRDIDGIEDLATAVGDVGRGAVRTKLSGGASASTELVTLPDGRRLVHKRGLDWGDPDDVAASVRHQADAEQLASLLGRALDAPVARVLRTEGDAVWMDFIDGSFDGVRALVGGPDGVRLGLLDVLSANIDRNGGNLLRRGDRLFGIDHGWTWGDLETVITAAFTGDQDRPAGHFADADRRWKPNPLHPRDIDVIADRLNRLRPDFDKLGRGAWLDYSLAVLRRLRRYARGTERLYA